MSTQILIQETSTLQTMLDHLEELWGCLDGLFAELEPRDWSRKHGPDWVLADLPYHLAYFDRDIIADPIEQGPNLPLEARLSLSSQVEINAWNAQKLAERPAGQTVEQSLDQMRASREVVRRVVARLNEADLQRPAWQPLLGLGWLTVQDALTVCRQHTWIHFIEARLHLERDRPRPSPATTHGAVGGYMQFFPLMLNHDLAGKIHFTAVMAFTEAGVGPWTISVADGACLVTEGQATRPDLVITQSPECYVKTNVGMLDPATAIQTGEIQVSNFESLETFGQLFPG